MPDFWWKRQESGNPFEKSAVGLVDEHVKAIETARRPHLERISENHRLYTGRGRLVGNMLSPILEPGDDQVENLAKSIVDTGVALVMKQRFRPAYVTDGAEFSVQRRAKLLEKYTEGLYQTLDVTRQLRRAGRHGCIGGTGIVQVSPDWANRRPKLEPVMIDQLYVDEWESRDGRAREAHKRYPADRNKLMRRFPKLAEEIGRAPGIYEGEEVSNALSIPVNQVWVTESWRLPSEAGADDGAYMVSIHGVREPVLFRPFKKPRLPFAKFSWTEPEFGWYGSGLMDEIRAIQDRIHRYSAFRDECIDRLAYPRVWVPSGDYDRIETKLQPRIGVIAKYTQAIPTTETPRSVPPDIFEQLERDYQLGFRLTGIGEMTATARKPPDIRSGPGFREFADIELSRFQPQVYMWEEFAKDVTVLLIDQTRDMYLERPDLSPRVMWRSRDVARMIDWEDADIEEDAYSLSLEMASILSRTPAARLDMVIDLLQFGLVSGERALQLLGVPDLEREWELALAARNDIEATIEALYEGEREEPDPFQDLELGVELVTKAYLLVRRTAPEAVKANMRRWVELAQAELKKRAQKLAEEQAAAQAAAQEQVASEAGQTPHDAEALAAMNI